MILQPLRNCQRVAAMPFHAQRQRFHAGQREECIHRSHRRAEIAQPQHAARGDECNRSNRFERVGEHRAVIGTVGLGQAGKLVARLPVELARIHDQPADRIAVPVKELGARMDDNVRTVIEGTTKGRGRHGVVDDQRDPRIMRSLGNCGNVADHAPGIRQAFDEHAAGVVIDCRSDIRRIVDIDEAGFPSELAKALTQLVERAAIKLFRGDDVAARLHQRVERNQLGGMARRHA